MGADTEELVPRACVPSAIPAAERAVHAARLQRLFREGVQAREAIRSGYAFRFAPDWLPELAAFIENERKCCPFLRFTIEISPADGPVWLKMEGPQGTRELLDAELPG